MIASFRRAARSAARWATLTFVAVVAGAAGAGIVLVVRPQDSRTQASAQLSAPPSASVSMPPSSPPALPPADRQEWPDVDDLTSTTNGADGYRLTQPEAAATAVPLGGVVSMQGDDPGERVEISVTKVTDPFVYPKWPPLGGNRWVAVKVHIHNTGSVRFIAYPEKDALAIDTQGRWYHNSGPMTAGRGFQRLLIAPNYDADGTLVFEVTKTAEVARFRLTLKAGTPARTADWTL